MKFRNLWIFAAVMTWAASLEAAPVIYAPFDDSDATLTGNTPGTGLSGTWALGQGTTWSVSSPSLVFGALPTSGNRATGASQGGNTITTGTVADNSLKNAGLLEHGATLWFSLLWKMDDTVQSNGDAGFALGTTALSGVNSIPLTATGSAIGVSMSTSSGNLSASTWEGTTRSSSSTVGWGTRTSPKLIVGKIVWGADATKDDTIYVYTPGTDLALPASPVCQKSAVLDQSQFNRIAFATKTEGDPQIDEIRFGARYIDVVAQNPAPAYWDLDGTTAGAGGTGGDKPDGTWDTSSNWNPSSDGTGTTAAWTAGSEAIFAAGTNATGAYTVTVSGSQDIGGLVFEEGTVTLTGGTGLNMITNTSMTVVADRTATVATPITADGSARILQKDRLGTLVLSGNNTYTGSTVVEGGTLVLSGANSAATGGMTLNGGVTRFDSPASINGTARNVTVNSGGAVMFGPSFGTAADIATALANRIVVSSGGAIAADNYASANFDFNTPGLTNVSLGAVGTVSYTGTLTPNGTTYRLGGGGGTLTLNSALPAAPPLVVCGPGTVNLNGYDNTVTSLSSSGSPLLANGSVTDIILTVSNSSASAYSGVLADGTGGGKLSLAKSGSGTLTLSGINTYSGGLFVNQGNLTLSANTALGSPSNITFTGTSTLAHTVSGGTLSFPQLVTVNTGVTASIDKGGGGAGGTFNFNGGLSGSGTLSFISGASGLGTYNLNNASAFTGSVKIGANSSTATPLTISASALGDGGNIRHEGTGADLNFTYTGSGATFTNRQVEMASTKGIIINANGTGPLVISQPLSVAAAGGKTLTLAGTNTNNNAFNGNIADGSGAVISVKKQGAGTWVLSGENTYTGTNTVSAGILVLAGSQCLPDSGILNIAGGKVEARNREMVGTLQISGVATNTGTWGSSASAADNRNDTYFAVSGTGILFVGVPFPATGTLLIVR